jgi:hypothetical protein
MAYSNFTTISQVQSTFSLSLAEPDDPFSQHHPLQPTAYLQQTLQENLPLATAINTEKARSELLIAPILLEVRRQLHFKIGFFSGTEFTVDSSLGLAGFCDYILTAEPNNYEIQSPVLTLVEAKNENLKGGLGQCLAEMVAAQRFNQEQHNDNIVSIYGAVTTGNIWKFLALQGKEAFIDRRDYYINEIPAILGILCLPFQDILTSLTDPSSTSEVLGE